VYRQRGPLPDRRPWPQGDEPVAFFTDPELARFTVEATNEKLDRQESLRGDSA
jgi:hypothetical protein